MSRMAESFYPCDYCEYAPSRCEKCYFFRYETLEEQGRLIELPCKVGDTVYLIDFEEEEWEEATVDEIVITDERIEINSNYEIGTPSDCDYIAYSEPGARIMMEMWKLAELKGE